MLKIKPQNTRTPPRATTFCSPNLLLKAAESGAEKHLMTKSLSSHKNRMYKKELNLFAVNILLIACLHFVVFY